MGHRFLNKVTYPKLSDSALMELKQPFDTSEVLGVINSLSSRKATAPGGYGIKFYKAKASVLASLLLHMLKVS